MLILGEIAHTYLPLNCTYSLCCQILVMAPPWWIAVADFLITAMANL